MPHQQVSFAKKKELKLQKVGAIDKTQTSCYHISLFQDINVMHGRKKFVIKPSKSGNFSRASRICEDSGMMLFKPKDNVTFYTVHEKARAAGLDLIWLNIGRDNPDAK